MKLYERKNYDISKLDSHWTDAQIVKLIGYNKEVLEIGTGDGSMAKHLFKKQGCNMTGIEKNKEACWIASPFYKKIINGDVSDIFTFSFLDEKFEVILCSNILEHLQNPEKVLRWLKNFLEKDGYFVIALPNIAYWQIRLNLALGKFDYTETGILDDTHLRFFTFKTSKELIKKAGLEIQSCSFDYDNGVPLIHRIFRLIHANFPQMIYSVRPQLFGFQFIFKATL